MCHIPEEGELKSQIKKLQRLRDQIKTWLASNEIKDKKILIDNRKLIEHVSPRWLTPESWIQYLYTAYVACTIQQMERFKACEKEMKTKAFSKEGLSANAKLDPKELLKIETANFVSLMVDELARQVEMTEAEVELLQGGAKKTKKGGTGTDKAGQLEDLNDRRKWHISRLELILRLMENGNMDPDRIVGLKEDISYFVESNTVRVRCHHFNIWTLKACFVSSSHAQEEDFEEDEGIYDELNLDEEEEMFGMIDRDDVQSSHDSMSVADTSEIVSHVPPPQNRSPVKAPTKQGSDGDGDKSPTQSKATKISSVPQRKPTLDGTAIRPTGLSAPSRSTSGTSAIGPVPGPLTSPPVLTPAPRAMPAVLPPIRYSAAAASAVAQSSAPAVNAAPSSLPALPSIIATPSLSNPTSQTTLPSLSPLPPAGTSMTAPQAINSVTSPTPHITSAVASPSMQTTSPMTTSLPLPQVAAVPATGMTALTSSHNKLPALQTKIRGSDLTFTSTPQSAESTNNSPSDVAPSPASSHDSLPVRVICCSERPLKGGLYKSRNLSSLVSYDIRQPHRAYLFPRHRLHYSQRQILWRVQCSFLLLSKPPVWRRCKHLR